jgi:DNA modification methylase
VIHPPLDSIITGDCIDTLSGLPEGSIDLIFADPPYNLQLSHDLYRPNQTKVEAVDDSWDKFASFEEYDDFTRKWLSACRRVMKDNGTIWIIGTYHNIFRVGTIIQDMGFWILNDVIWIKDNPIPNFRGVRFTNAHETLLWAQKKRGSKYTFNHHAMKSLNEGLQMRSDWYLPICTGKERCKVNGEKAHSTQKPEALLYRIILASSNPGDIILDPFFGTGTTGAVAKKLGRHYIGIERDPGYIKIAKERLETVEFAPDSVVDVLNPRKQKRIPFGFLLEAGYLKPGQTLYFMKNDISAVILADGSLKCNVITGSIHSVARALSGNVPANGWECWLFEDSNGKRLPIDTFRKIIRNKTIEQERT